MQYSVFRKLKLKKNIINYLFFVFILYTLYSILSTPVYAQQVSLSISPPLLEIFTKPKQSFLFAYKITNHGDPIVLIPQVNNFIPRGILGKVQILNTLEGPITFNLDNAEIVMNQPFFLKNNESTQLLLRIKINPGAPSGDYYYNFNVTSDNSGSINQNAPSQVKTTIGANILITVSHQGEVEINPQIDEFSVNAPYQLKIGKSIYKIFDSADPVAVKLVLSNEGNNLIKPEGDITLKGNFGETAKYDIFPENVLAHSSRLLHASPSAGIDCQRQPQICQNNYSLIITGFFIGKYNLKSNIVFADGKKVITRSVVFFGLPFKLIIATILCIFIIIVLFKKIQKDS